MLAKKKDDVSIELRKCPKIQEKLIEMLKGSIEDPESVTVYDTEEMDADMTDEMFEKQIEEDIKKLKSGIKDDNDAEETSWDSI